MPIKILPVIHYQNNDQALRNADVAFEASCDGVFLIHMEAEDHLLPEVALKLKSKYPDKLIGINNLSLHADASVRQNIELDLDMTWTDSQLTYSKSKPWHEAKFVMRDKAKKHDHLLFSGVAFKHQKPEPNPELAAKKAIEFGFIPTTSGSATGVAAESSKVLHIRNALRPKDPLAIASGITPENAREFAPYLTHILVSTGVSSDFYNFDMQKLIDLRKACDSV